MIGTRQANATLQLHDLPNPYPVPNKPFSLNFHPPGVGLRVGDIIGCINRAQDIILAHIALHGDTPIPELPDESLAATFHTVRFKIARHAAPGSYVLSYRDTIPTLKAFGAKMSREGFHGLLADIILTQDGALLGSAVMYRVDDE